MLKIFNDNTAATMTTEISYNPSILFDTTISGKQLFFFGIRLGDTIEKIRHENIRTTSMEKIPAIATSSSYHDEKAFYFVDGKEIEFELTDRIISIFENNGWLHMDTGAKYRIRDKVVVEFALHDKLLDPYKKIQKNNIENKFGMADKIKENWENYDGTLFDTDYIYSDRQIRIHFQDWDKEIVGINIGETLLDFS
jgi:hypothetical protein